MAQNLLQINNLVKVYQEKTVLNNVSFEVFNGEFLSILGPSGCGKTTLLRILVGLAQQTSGEILLNGQNISALSPSKRGMGIVFQNYALFQNMTVYENISYALRFNNETKSHSDEITQRLIKQLGLSEHSAKKPHKLSGGQQQRVAIARTLAMNPRVILLDEPLSALDAATRLTLRDELKRIQAEFKTTMIYITHDQEEAFDLSDRVMVMDNGVVVQIDTPENIINSPANDYVEEFVINNLKRKISALQKHVR